MATAAITTPASIRFGSRVPAGLLADTQRRAATDGVTASAVIVGALWSYLTFPSTAAARLAGRLIEAEAGILGEHATTVPYGVRLAPRLNDELCARAVVDGDTATSVLIAALTAYVVGSLAVVHLRFAARVASATSTKEN